MLHRQFTISTSQKRTCDNTVYLFIYYENRTQPINITAHHSMQCDA